MSIFERIRFFSEQPDLGSGAAAAPAPAPTPAAAPAAAPAPAPDSAAAPAASAAPSAPLGELDIESIFRGDPFAPKPAAPAAPAAAPPAASSTAPVPPTPAPVPQTPAAPGVAAPAAAPAAAAPVPGAPPTPDLSMQLADLNNRLAEVIAARPAAAPTPATSPVDDIEVPAYDFTIPQPLAQALSSDDPNERLRATGLLIKGTAQAVHRTLVQSMREETARVLPSLVGAMIQQQAQSRAIYDDFYGAYPMLNRQELYPVVAQTAMQLANARGYRGWTPEFKKDLADAVHAILRQVGGVPVIQPAPTAVPAPTPPAPPAISQPGARPAAPQPSEFMKEFQTLI